MSSKGSPVILHIYDVPNANKYIHLFIDKEIGVYHTGVQVFNVEYSFGGHPHDYTGIFKTPPKDISTLSVSDNFRYKESKVIGNTSKNEEQITKIVEEMGSSEFKGKNYHLIRKNCNHFSDAFSKKLCGKGIPESLNKMVEILQNFPIIESKIPKEFVTPKALQNDVDQHEKQKKIKQQKKEQTSETNETNSGNTETSEDSDKQN